MLAMRCSESGAILQSTTWAASTVRTKVQRETGQSKHKVPVLLLVANNWPTQLDAHRDGAKQAEGANKNGAGCRQEAHSPRSAPR